jgi:translation initiation factor IF-1
MPREDAFRVEGVVLETLSDRTCRVELSNGHTLLGFLTRRKREELGAPQDGQHLILQVSPFDLSSGRIVGLKQKVDE